MKKTKSMPSLPEEIITVILSMLPVKSISRFRCVCKLWCDLYKNPRVTEMHLNHSMQTNKFNVILKSEFQRAHYRIDFDPKSSLCDKAVEIAVPWSHKNPDTDSLFIGSLNGLLCVNSNGSTSGDEILLWNPSTGEYKKLPKPPVRDERSDGVVYGFGYDHMVGDYKLVRVVTYSRYDSDSEVLVYTLGSNAWKKNEDIPYSVFNAKASTKPLNGALHWVATKGSAMKKKTAKVIVSFDIARELTEEIRMPSCFPDKSYAVEDVGVLGEYESYAVLVEDVGVLGEDLYLAVNDLYRRSLDVWVMKEYGVADSWTKLVRVSKRQTNWLSSRAGKWQSQQGEWVSLTRVQQLYSRKRQILVFRVKCVVNHVCESTLVSYDLENGEVSRISSVLDIPDVSAAESYVESLVSLNSGEYIKATEGS